MNSARTRIERRRAAAKAPAGVSRPPQAQRQAPWRLQVQSIGTIFLVAISLVLIAAVYLSISLQAGKAGVEVQDQRWAKSELIRQIDDYRTRLADLTNNAVMEKRAAELGFRLVSPDDIEYVLVPEYPGRQPAVLAPQPGTVLPNTSILNSTYRQSLWEWLFQGWQTSSLSPGGLP